MHAEVDLAADAAAPGRARQFLLTTLRSWRCSSVDAGDAAVIVSLLATNAVRYDGDRLSVGLKWDSTGVSLHVDDGSTTPPTLSPGGPYNFFDSYAEHGRGIDIINSLALDWGTTVHAHGKSVWALLATTTSAS